MFYLLATLFLGITSCTTLFRVISSSTEGREQRVAHASALLPLLFVMGSVLYTLPLFTTMLASLGGTAGPFDPLDLAGLAVPGLAAGSLCLLIAAGFMLAQGLRCRRLSFAAAGTLVIAGMSGGLGVVASAQHVIFSNEHVGVLYLANLNESERVDDLDCSRGILLINWDADEPNGESVRYRCPTSVVLMQNAGTPFIPWPHYQQGESQALADYLLELMASAKRL